MTWFLCPWGTCEGPVAIHPLSLSSLKAVTADPTLQMGKLRAKEAA